MSLLRRVRGKELNWRELVTPYVQCEHDLSSFNFSFSLLCMVMLTMSDYSKSGRVRLYYPYRLKCVSGAVRPKRGAVSVNYCYFN